MKQTPVQPTLLNEYIKGWLHCGMFAAAVATITAVLLWSVK